MVLHHTWEARDSFCAAEEEEVEELEAAAEDHLTLLHMNTTEKVTCSKDLTQPNRIQTGTSRVRSTFQPNKQDLISCKSHAEPLSRNQR